MSNTVYIISVFISGMVFGALFMWFISKLASRRSEEKFNAALDEATALLKSNFAEISLDTLSKTTDMLSGRLKSEREISAKEISGQKEIIEKRIETLNSELLKLTGLINTMENARNMQMGELKSIIDDSRAKTSELFHVTNGLKETLSSKQGRGQWAERMADDVLNYAGLKEGINYIRQQKSDVTGKRPDFTFLLPNGTTLNMDVKFPYENYKRYMESPENEKAFYAKEFIKDVKNHIKAISGREYIDTENGTVNCAIMFIPNEKIYSFIFETAPELLDMASKEGVMVCSPVTTISVLAVIRQAAENFAMERRAKDLMQAMGSFRKEWIKYSDGFTKLGDLIGRVSSEYDSLRTTRNNKLESSMNKLEALKNDEIE